MSNQNNNQQKNNQRNEDSQSKPNLYTVRKGDTWKKIADKVNKPWKDITRKNGIKSPYKLKVGQKLKV